MKPVAGELTDEEMFATGRVSRLEQALAPKFTRAYRYRPQL